jgi:hypothetical protein
MSNPLLPLGGDERFHVVRRDLLEWPPGEERNEVDAQVRLVVTQRPRLQPDRLAVFEVAPARLRQIEPLALRALCPARLDRAPELCFRL